MKILKAATDKRISGLTNAVNKLMDQVKVLQTSPPIIVSVHTDPIQIQLMAL